MIHELLITTYKVPIIRKDDGEIEEATQLLTDEMISGTPELIEIDTDKENLTLKLPEISKKIGAFNKRQYVFLQNDTSKDYILKKILKRKQ